MAFGAFWVGRGEDLLGREVRHVVQPVLVVKSAAHPGEGPGTTHQLVVRSFVTASDSGVVGSRSLPACFGSTSSKIPTAVSPATAMRAPRSSPTVVWRAPYQGGTHSR